MSWGGHCLPHHAASNPILRRSALPGLSDKAGIKKILKHDNMMGDDEMCFWAGSNNENNM